MYQTFQTPFIVPLPTPDKSTDPLPGPRDKRPGSNPSSPLNQIRRERRLAVPKEKATERSSGRDITDLIKGATATLSHVHTTDSSR